MNCGVAFSSSSPQPPLFERDKFIFKMSSIGLSLTVSLKDWKENMLSICDRRFIIKSVLDMMKN